MILSRLRGIALLVSLVLYSSNALGQVRFEVDQFEISGNNPLGTKASQKILSEFTGAHEGIERLQSAAASLEQALHAEGFNFHRVTLPPQTLAGGKVILDVQPLVINSVTTSGNKFFSNENLKRSLPQLIEGKTPNTSALSRALAVANFNTAKRTRLTFGRGDNPGTLDARIEVRDRSPHQVYGWLNNTGTENPARSRIGLGYQHRNVFDRDHNLVATYTTSPEEPSDVQQYGINYQIPLYKLTSSLSLFRIESDVNSGRVAEFFDVSGSGETTGIRYSQILNKLGDLRQRVYFDVTDKLFDNNVDFQGTNIGTDIRSRPLSLTWQLEWEKERGSGAGTIGIATNLSGGSLNDQTSYTAARVDAPQDWQAIRFNLNHEFNLPSHWKVGVSLRGQYTDDPLISGEQFGLGGSFGPRGFEEREVGVDRGVAAKVQLWGPPLRQNLQLGVFADHGYGTILRPIDDQVDSRELTSAGLSLMWRWSNRLVLTLDVGHVLEGLDEPELTQDGDTRAHFNLVYRFSGE